MLKTVIFAVIATAFLIGLNFAVSAQTEFTVRVENIASADGLTANDGSKYPFALSPGLFITSADKVKLFEKRRKATPGIEAQAEDGNPSVLAMELKDVLADNEFGVFNTPVGANMPSPILPGGAFEFKFTASKGAKLNLFTMFGQSNDLFYAFEKPIELFRFGKGISGNFTRQLMLWDAGTEVNEAPGIGNNQGPRQAMANTGPEEGGTVRVVKDGFKYPKTQEVIRVTILAKN